MLTGIRTNENEGSPPGERNKRSQVYSSGCLYNGLTRSQVSHVFFPLTKNPRNHNRALSRTKKALATKGSCDIKITLKTQYYTEHCAHMVTGILL